MSNKPVGVFSSVQRLAGGTRLVGWAIDPDIDGPAIIDTYFDGGARRGGR